MMELIQDLRGASRTLLHSPVFAVSVIVILALGIGANAAIFSLVDAYVLRPQPGVIAPDRLVDIRGTRGEKIVGQLTYPDYADLRNRSRMVSGLMAYRPTVLDIGRGLETRRVQAALVSSDYFAMLGAGVSRGRTFLPDEERHALGDPVVVVSDRLWHSLFGADPDLVGKAVAVNGRRFTVIGVASAGFRGHSASDACDTWVPLAMFATTAPGALGSLDSRTWRWLSVVGRLAPGVTLAQARAEMSALATQIDSSGSAGGDAFGVSLTPTRPSLLDDTLAGFLIASVGALFLIACANVSNLFLARASARRRDVATRLALGAPRRRVLQQFMTESVALGLLGGAVGLLVATPTSRALLAWSTAGIQEFPDAVDLRVSATLIAFVLVLSVLSGVLLMTLRHYQSLVSVPEPAHVLLLSLQPSHQQYDDARAREFFLRLLERLDGMPGVRSASLSREMSLGDSSFFTERVAAGPAEPGPGAAWRDVAYAVVAPGFFATMGARLVSGRDFSSRDRERAASAVIVNRSLALQLWPDREPLGQLLWIGGERSGREVIGVAADRPTREGPRPFVYEPLFQRYPWGGSRHLILVRASGDPLSLVPGIRREAAALDPHVPLFNPRTVETEIAGSRFFERLALGVVGGCGLLALLLAAIGLHGVTSYWVSLRTKEFGIRIAIGASTNDVLRLVMGQAMKLSLVGVAIGLAATLALDSVWTSVLSDVRPAGLSVLVAEALLLTATMLAASCQPARQATKSDPMTVIRAE